ncbi:MAG: holdfast anchoring protein HfaB [Alphaproteobacteria bacterium]|nr:holdfast anchoring protein HfaB [Alphaproteobacteria bacterium]MBL6940147.1 holdfast anchoring protein HfaB [Alphaproteobacteria bacterium]MBL7100234.1 holdfast anchoring protein HfaB [Alphaproteobacteria bacterium]
MTRRGRKHLLKPLALLAVAFALEGCISPSPDSIGRYTAPIGGSPVISNETPYSAALRCMAGYTGQHPIRIAVGQIADYTGKSESDNSGRKITQGAALMAMSALSKAGVQLVERFDTSVAEMELKYANNRLIGADQSGGPDYRQIMAGSIPGSDYYLVGGITELNFNIRSEGANGDGGGTATNGVKGQIGLSMYVMNVGLDLRLVDTKTLQVVDVISYQKQIIGRQISAGVFDFLGANFFDASVGESALEPIQLAVRSTIERAVLEMTSRLYHTNGSCAAGSDPLAGADDDHRPAPPATASNAPVTARNEDHYNADTSRNDPYRFYNSSDPNAGLRGSE